MGCCLVAALIVNQIVMQVYRNCAYIQLITDNIIYQLVREHKLYLHNLKRIDEQYQGHSKCWHQTLNVNYKVLCSITMGWVRNWLSFSAYVSVIWRSKVCTRSVLFALTIYSISTQCVVRVWYHVSSAGFCLSLYLLHVLNGDVNMIQTKKIYYRGIWFTDSLISWSQLCRFA